MAGSASDPRASVVIAGAGPAGLLLALALERAGVPSTLVDRDAMPSVLRAGFDGRALALMLVSRRVFEAVGLWCALQDAAEPVHGVRVKDRGTGAALAYDARETGDPAFGYGIENRLLRRRLLELALARPEITLIAPARIDGIERFGDRVEVILADGRRLGARLLVGADGWDSTVRARAGISIDRWGYGQAALTFAVRHRAPHGQLVREYLRPAGPLALLPIGERLCSVTWVEPPAHAERLLEADPDALLTALQNEIDGELGDLELCGRPTAHPLGAQRARRYVAPRVALIGDAAHRVHPIHAQGFNLAVRDVAALAESLVDAWRAGHDPGGSEALVRYDRWRQADARFVIGLTDGLNRLFSTDLAPARWLRGFGFAALDRLLPLKQLAMRRGMGLQSGLPRLARGDAL